jgi:hypothetical protein
MSTKELPDHPAYADWRDCSPNRAGIDMVGCQPMLNLRYQVFQIHILGCFLGRPDFRSGSLILLSAACSPYNSVIVNFGNASKITSNKPAGFNLSHLPNVILCVSNLS